MENSGQTLRKRIVSESERSRIERETGTLDIPAIATILVTSEDAANPVDHLFVPRGDTGKTRWVAADPGEQCLILDFDQPQTINGISLEIEETQVPRSQELTISVSTDGGQTYREIQRQEFNFNPLNTTVEKEHWTVSERGVTQLCLRILPDKSGGSARASLTSLVLH